MTPEELKAARKKLFLTQAGLGRVLKLKGDAKQRARTVRRWEDGEREISGPVEVAVTYIVKYGF